MLLTKLGRPNVAILLKTQENMERPSDIQGLIYVPFKDDLAKRGWSPPWQKQWQHAVTRLISQKL